MPFYEPEQLAYLMTLQRRGPGVDKGYTIDQETGVFTFDPPLDVGEIFDFAELREGEYKREILVSIGTEQATFHWGRHTPEPKGISRGMPFCEYLWIVEG